MAANNKDRKLILNSLDKCIKLAYSGVTDIEYQALKVVRDYIKTFYDKEVKNERTGRAEESS